MGNLFLESYMLTTVKVVGSGIVVTLLLQSSVVQRV